jgi:signal transduction histidine kinase
VAAFAFTIAFTLITRQALLAKDRAEQLRQEIEAANARLRAYAAQAEDLATTRERNRVAREIHDGIGHYLTVVKTQLDAAAAILPAQPDKAREAILKSAKLTGDALDDVRRSVGALRTDTARPPLPEALQALVHEAGLPVTIRLAGEPRPLAPGVEHALFRSAQEALTNIRKHAGATAAELSLDFAAGGRVTLAVTDNGRGAAGTAAGFGLVGIRERIAVIGGRVESGNRPGGGFTLTVEVPA